MRVRIITFISMVFFVAATASSWEGAAAASPDGELPSTGLYVATNSFPRNTVVDIFNIETNKSTRAIVAAGLDSPGLLAIVSREAAEIIGMRPGSISRIRLTQPSDPIAYLRFTESLADGIPPYDSGSVITGETYRRDDTPSAGSAARSETPPAVEPAQTRVSSVPPYFLEPEWGGRSTRDIIDLPSAPLIVVPGDPSSERTAGPAREEEASREIAATVHEDESAQEIALITPEEETLQEVALITPEDESTREIALITPEEEAQQEIAESTEEEEFQRIAGYTPVEEEQAEKSEPAVENAVAQYNIVPSQERPPQGTIYGIDPADIIPQITRASVAEPERAPVLEPLIESISAVERTPAIENTLVPEIASVTGNTPVTERTPIADTKFSIPRIYELNRGSYYVQLAAVDTPESVESAASLIDLNYGPVVYKDGDNWYRILLGPLNQGESAAILQRFRNIGYRDAFVRQGG